jgi:hypothetical protein
MLNVTKQLTTNFCNVHAAVSANITMNRRKSYIHKTTSRVRNDSSNAVYGRMELDSHADTIVLGSNAIILQYTNRECDVAPYSDSYEPICNVPIVTGATAVTSSETGETIILVFHEAIWMGNRLEHSLLNPNQMRHHGITVQDNPYAPNSLHITSPDDEFMLPLQSDGTTIFFNSRMPTSFELANCLHIPLSSVAPWNSRDVQFPTTAHHVDEEKTIQSLRTDMRIDFDLSTTDHDNVPITQIILDRLISEVRIDVPIPKTFISDNRHTGVSVQELSERWFIGLTQAQETIRVTTQNCT